MSINVMGRTGRMFRAGVRRRRWTVLTSCIVIAAGLMLVRSVLAVHLVNAIELDGNATTQTYHDWDQVYTDVQNGNTATSGAVAVSFAPDGSTNATIFTGGGSKDPIDLNQWAWKDGAGGLPDKDNLTNAFAARYSLPPTDVTGNCTNGTGGPGQDPYDPTIPCEVLFFGSDRFDNSGDAQQGFWFFQNPVSTRYDSDGNGTLDADCPQKIGGGIGFCDPRNGNPATHVAGDLLIISNFSNGGTVSIISIYVWDPTVNGNLRLLQEQDNANCATADDNDPFCGLVNPLDNTPTGGWSYTDKSGNSTYLQGELYEGGVNLSALGLGNECFASVAAESRSSTSTTAVLKDFVIGQFANCFASMTTTPSVGAGATVAPGTSVTDIATVTGSGVASPPTPTGDVTFYLCGPIATGTCDSGGDLVGTATLSGANGVATATSPAVSKTTPGRYCFRAEWPGDSNYPALTHAGTANSECFIVQDTTSAVSAQNWLPNDSATITSANGTPLSGTLSFQLYTGDTCAAGGSPVAGQLYTFPLSGATSPVTRVTTNTSFTVTASASYSWLVTFLSSDPNVVGSSKCEKTTLTITN